MRSILQTEKKCFISGRDYALQKHHIFRGKNRKLSEKYGFWVWLNVEYHTGQMGIHLSTRYEILSELQKKCQEKFEEKHTRDEFMDIIGKNYL